MMADPARYARPARFDGFRFARANGVLQQQQQQRQAQAAAAAEDGAKTTTTTTGSSSPPSCEDIPDRAPGTFTTATAEWPIWGLGKTAWYVPSVPKSILDRCVWILLM